MKYVNPESLAKPHGYNHGVVLPAGAGTSVLFLSGQIGVSPEGKLVGPDFTAQFERALMNLLDVVWKSGGKPESIGKLTIFVTDTAEYAAHRRTVGEAYRRRMGKHFPAMTLVEVKALLEPGAKVEIEGMAVV